MTQNRTNIALRAVNPSFSIKSNLEVNYTLPLDEFQQTLIQQTAARKATREAAINRRPRRRFANGNSDATNSFSNAPDQQLFRLGSPSQHGGYNNNSTGNFNNFNNYSTNNNHNNSKKSNNPFRQ